MEEQALNIKDILKILKKKFNMILVVTLITTIASIGITYFVITPTYLTSAKLFIGMPTIHSDGSGNASWDFSYYKQLLEPYSEIIKSDDLIERAIRKGNLNISQQALSGALSVQSNSNQVLNLSIVTGNSVEGVEILNAVIDEFIETSNKLIENSNVEVISSPKISNAPISPNKPKNIIFGIGFGLAIGIALVLIIEYMDNSIKDEDEAERIMGIPMLGTVPEYNEKITYEEEKKEKGRRKRNDT